MQKTYVQNSGNFTLTRDSRKHVQESVVHRNGSAVPSASSASYRSSLEVTPENDVNPRSSLGESSCKSKSSRELVKVLDRMWRLEEQQASNIATAKALIKELDSSQAQEKELVHEKKMNRQIMESLMKQITEDRRVNEIKDPLVAASIVHGGSVDEANL
ncbi:uncharacterized protein LOC131632193 isoform X2 [Vicia villosa]|uniref:uncharacterized protein LOC131632193 isoform X2 n=1 Tax=Vicia villosa TaxID=3911 RepID=UPI00273C7CD7|nr:uncharacterized protein LOC131632193 isoform X2 [Vicia villosa]XP_058758958.1 uncharacterized protein LOC131632193 isoform X2 [Vicia villosa]XP_058758959.1 uncharacterized protein LOC131632193 isoform X2 [Vicia villosa]